MIIGVAGKARSGKDTFASLFITHFHSKYGRNFVRTAFADALKNKCAMDFNLSRDQLWGDKKEVGDIRYPRQIFPCNNISYEPNLTPREIMQKVGEFYRSIDIDYWVRCLDKMIHRFEEEDVGDYIIADIRHQNEMEYVKHKKGVLIKIQRPDLQKIHGMDHVSETTLDRIPDDYYDIVIDNSGPISDLENVVLDTIEFVIRLEKITKGDVYNG